MFYVAFKWVQRHWPGRVGRDNRIAELPVEFWIDGQHHSLHLTAKIRLYDKAAHMVICEWHEPDCMSVLLVLSRLMLVDVAVEVEQQVLARRCSVYQQLFGPPSCRCARGNIVIPMHPTDLCLVCLCSTPYPSLLPSS